MPTSYQLSVVHYNGKRKFAYIYEHNASAIKDRQHRCYQISVKNAFVRQGLTFLSIEL